MLSAGPVPPGRAAVWLSLKSARRERLGNANVDLSERVQLLPSLSSSPGIRADSGPPRVPQASSGPTESIISATITIPQAFLFAVHFDVYALHVPSL